MNEYFILKKDDEKYLAVYYNGRYSLVVESNYRRLMSYYDMGGCDEKDIKNYNDDRTIKEVDYLDKYEERPHLKIYKKLIKMIDDLSDKRISYCLNKYTLELVKKIPFEKINDDLEITPQQKDKIKNNIESLTSLIIEIIEQNKKEDAKTC